MIMVVVDKRSWTIKALNCACRLALRRNAMIALVQLVPVTRIAMLGTDLGYLNFTQEDEDNLEDYTEIIESYGVKYSAHLFQATSARTKATLDAAALVDAQIVFATVAKSYWPRWQKFQLARLRSGLTKHQRQLVDQPVSNPDRLNLGTWAQSAG